MKPESVNAVAEAIRKKSRENGCEVYCEHAVAHAAIRAVLQTDEVRNLIQGAKLALYSDERGGGTLYGEALNTMAQALAALEAGHAD
jgi:hypothetical protein